MSLPAAPGSWGREWRDVLDCFPRHYTEARADQIQSVFQGTSDDLDQVAESESRLTVFAEYFFESSRVEA
jgi:hypothetical protein